MSQTASCQSIDNLDDMGNFLERYNLPNPRKQKTDNQKSPAPIKEMEIVVKNLPIRNRTRMLAFIAVIQHLIGNSSQSNWARKIKHISKTISTHRQYDPI